MLFLHVRIDTVIQLIYNLQDMEDIQYYLAQLNLMYYINL